jgi:hypothetical protein
MEREQNFSGGAVVTTTMMATATVMFMTSPLRR